MESESGRKAREKLKQNTENKQKKCYTPTAPWQRSSHLDHKYTEHTLCNTCKYTNILARVETEKCS